MAIIFTPGTGPIDGATFENAEANVREFIRDLNIKHVIDIERRSDLDCDGRFGFVLYFGLETSVAIQMPGLPLEQVRCRLGDNAWRFPRLYVDGNSWLWPYALSIAEDKLAIPDRETP